MSMSKAVRRQLGVCGLIASCALLVALPLFLDGPSCGHDFDFHLQSWLAANQAWHSVLSPGGAGRAALLYAHWLPTAPHWLPAANYGAGEPRFVFYPPLSWMLGALLGFLLPWTWVPQVFTFLAFMGCGLAFYRLARTWVRRPVAAGAACVYLANPYLLFVAYERTAYGELLGAISMPLVLVYALRPRVPIVRLALVIAALWFTNAPAAVMGCYLVALCAVYSAWIARGLVPVAQALAALALGTGLASVYVVPAWYEQRWVEIARVVGPGMRVEDSFLFGHSGEPFHDHVLHTASWIAVALLIAGLLGTVCAWIAQRAWRRAQSGEDSAERGLSRIVPATLPVFLAVALGAILLLLLPLSEPAWRFAPELRFLQFPWRWLLVAGVVATLSLALAAESLWGPHAAAPEPGWPHRSLLITLAISAALCVGAWYVGHSAQHAYGQSCDEEDNVTAQVALAGVVDSTSESTGPSENDPAGFEGTDEYTPAGADNGEIQQGLLTARRLLSPDDDEGDDSASPNPSWNPGRTLPGRIEINDRRAEHLHLSVVAPTPSYVVLRLLDYPAWQVRVNGHVVKKRPHREDGLLTIPVQAGATTIDVLYQATPDVYAGRALSLLALAALGGLSASLRRRRSSAEPWQPRAYS